MSRRRKIVIPGLDPGIQQQFFHLKQYRKRKEKNWIAGSSPAMTIKEKPDAESA